MQRQVQHSPILAWKYRGLTWHHLLPSAYVLLVSLDCIGCTTGAYRNIALLKNQQNRRRRHNWGVEGLQLPLTYHLVRPTRTLLARTKMLGCGHRRNPRQTHRIDTAIPLFDATNQAMRAPERPTESSNTTRRKQHINSTRPR